ncbi:MULTISPECIES: PhzF family phenazine biosynthesis protein [unclassified Microbacterium]|uniref:PhzF family phenazine biosynthesis protein n=1 Tax=unclassified Microbacterium TaxID=2609290 RepID=UPI0020063040|nr:MULTISPECIES: PhzF family phenazine biosynthesis protein [unclassified Microbacterium]
MASPDVLRYSAFSARPDGGNPAGVVLDASRLEDIGMQRIAAEVDYAETAFITGTTDDGARTVRYFSPIAEVPFCGHATVATAVALADGGFAQPGEVLRFATPVGPVAITVSSDATGMRASFTSVPPVVTELPADDLDAILREIGVDAGAVDADLPPRISNAGNPHPIIVIRDRAGFDAFTFDPDRVRVLMNERGWPATITVLHRLAPDRFVARNLFPVGRITEDPATGSAAAAVGAYLRELGVVPEPSRVIIEQGAHVGRPSELIVDVPPEGGIVVSGYAVPIV